MQGNNITYHEQTIQKSKGFGDQLKMVVHKTNMNFFWCLSAHSGEIEIQVWLSQKIREHNRQLMRTLSGTKQHSLKCLAFQIGT